MEAKKIMLEWMLRALMAGTISKRKKSAFARWLAGEELHDLKREVMEEGARGMFQAKEIEN